MHASDTEHFEQAVVCNRQGELRPIFSLRILSPTAFPAQMCNFTHFAVEPQLIVFQVEEESQHPIVAPLGEHELATRQKQQAYLQGMCLPRNQRHPVFLRTGNDLYDFETDAEWIVDKIVEGPAKVNGKQCYKVRYRGFSKAADRWQEIEELNRTAAGAVNAFKEKKTRK